VRVGPTCVDKYEASTWQIDPSNSALVAKVQDGTVTLADLTGAGATPLCETPGDGTFPSTFPASGQWTSLPGTNPPSPGVYAVSVAGTIPSQCTTWFQAAQACRLAGKRLLTNLEWQDAAAGTPDPGTDNGTTNCSVATYTLVPTGSRTSCVSAWGAFDMVGNADEWVADWADMANADSCTTWDYALGFDSVCFGGSGPLAGDPYSGIQSIPAALRRGTDFTSLSADPMRAGVFAVSSRSIMMSGAGYRCGR
jgi:formylglycine-generating enzyme required for sulfatase activity